MVPNIDVYDVVVNFRVDSPQDVQIGDVIKSINNEKECYIYSVLNSKREDNKFSKKINRILYKLNKGVLD